MDSNKTIERIKSLDINDAVAFLEKREKKIFSIINDTDENRSVLLKNICSIYFQKRNYHKISHTYFHLLGKPDPLELYNKFGREVSLYFARAHFHVRRFTASRKIYFYLSGQGVMLDKEDIENYDLLKANEGMNKTLSTARLKSLFRDMSIVVIAIVLYKKFPEYKIPISIVSLSIIAFLIYLFEYRKRGS